jgi:hypothetical protein
VRLGDAAPVGQEVGRHRGQQERDPAGRLVEHAAHQEVGPQRKEERPGDGVQPDQQDRRPEERQGRDQVDTVEGAHVGLPVEEDGEVLPGEDVLGDQGDRRIVARDLVVEERRDPEESRHDEERGDHEPAPALGATRR